MRRLFFNAEGRLRNGCWVLIFFLVLAVFGLAQAGVQWLGRKAGLAGDLWLRVLGTLGLLATTWTVLKLRKEPFASVGFQLNRRWLAEFGWGTAIGMVQMAIAVLLVWTLGGVRLELDPARTLRALSSGLFFFLVVAINEETLFRGFPFQRLRDGIGVWPTQLLMAAFFALSHWDNPGMHGATKVWATLDIGIGAVVYGVAYFRTGSLALPIGLHLGWNWMQGHVLGFGVSGFQEGGWFRPVFLGKPEWLTGGTFGVEASIFAVLVDLTLLGLLLAWRGSLPPPPAEPA